MIYREYETRFDDYERKAEHRIVITTDTYELYATIKSAVEKALEHAEEAEAMEAEE